MSFNEASWTKGMYGKGPGPVTSEKMRDNDGTAVTVICISYNQEKFIAQALDSFLMQKTNFKYKIFVGEDCGTDHTADIIRDYAERYPDVVVPFIREKNMGAQRNLIDLCQRASTPYLAFCEGDDYWIDENKLQKQFDYMEAHKELAACTMKTEIDAPKNWYLRAWYRAINHKLIIPDSVPGYIRKDVYEAKDWIRITSTGHTSTYFFRWNYDLLVPSEYYEGMIGDVPLFLLQLGIGKAGVIGDIGSVYRINESSIYYNKDMTSLFLKTRISFIFWMSWLRRFALEYFGNQYPVTELENRIKLETANYLKTLIKLNDTKRIAEFFSIYPEAGKISLNAYLAFFEDVRRMTDTWTWEGYKLIARNRYCRNLLRPYAAAAKRGKAIKQQMKQYKQQVRGKAKNLVSFICYWLFSLVPKKKNVWVFSGFRKKAYMDNTMYMYEWVVAHHPEIDAWWITMSDEVYKKLKGEGKTVLKFRTWDCIRKLSRAQVAFIDHYVMSDYENISGFNDRIKTVQLWHGVGLKAMADLKNTNVPGVMFSSDILAEPGDSRRTCFLKKLKYARYAYFREKFERYFLLPCPGKEQVEKMAIPWHIPQDNCMYSGYPRNVNLHHAQNHDGDPLGVNVLYAPTYRWSPSREKELIQMLVRAFPDIEQCMEELDGQFVIRLHPHTWRNYSPMIQKALANYPRISYDWDKDVYTRLGTYSLMISDYSSIAYDFLLLDRPIVFFCPDLKEFTEQEVSLNYDYMEYSPGQKTCTWQETLEQVREYVRCPEKDSDWRHRVRDVFYVMDANDEYNSERIVQAVKERLGWKTGNT